MSSRNGRCRAFCGNPSDPLETLLLYIVKVGGASIQNEHQIASNAASPDVIVLSTCTFRLPSHSAYDAANGLIEDAINSGTLVLRRGHLTPVLWKALQPKSMPERGP